MKKIIFLSLLLYGLNLNAQQAWTQQKNDGYFQIGSSFLNYSSLHIGDLKSRDIPREIKESILSFYGEYGISDRLTGTLVLPYHITSSGDLTTNWNGFAPQKGNLSALGNVNMGLTYKLYQKRNLILSSKLGVALNSAKTEAETGLRTGFDAFAFTPSILAGIGNDRFFASAETGISFSTNGYLSRFIFNAQIGKYLLQNKRLLFILGLSNTITLGQSSADNLLKLDGNAVFTGLYLNEQSYYALNLKFGYELIDNGTLWFSAAGGAAKNVGQNVAYALSFGYQF